MRGGARGAYDEIYQLGARPEHGERTSAERAHGPTDRHRPRTRAAYSRNRSGCRTRRGLPPARRPECCDQAQCAADSEPRYHTHTHAQRLNSNRMSIECLACPTLGPSAPLSDTPRGNLRWAHYPHFPIAVLVPSFEHGRKCTSGALSAPGAVLVLPFEPPASRRVSVPHAGLLRFPVRGSYRNVGPPRATCTRRPRAGVSLGRFRASSGLPFVGLDVSAPPAACGRRGSCFCCC